MLHFLDRKRTIAKPDYNRWLVPPAALAIHLSIGMAYGFSVFWIPLLNAIGITKPVSCPDDMSWLAKVFSTRYDWEQSALGVTFTLFFVLLGSSAALFGSWLERNGPRKAGVAASLCWAGGLFISAIGVYYHQIVLLWLGAGVIGGCGLGLGYISPVSTLVKWFPDKRGMATGMAIMGFGGGAMIGMPFADKLIKFYSTPSTAGVWQRLVAVFSGKDIPGAGVPVSVGVWETFVTLGCIYLVVMLCGALAYRIPPPGWKPHGWSGPVDTGSHLITQGHVHVRNAHKAPQFWLLWAVLCLNVSAGIGIIYMASPMLQHVFGGKLIGNSLPYGSLAGKQLELVATVGAGFGGILSLFNIGGRIFWASLSDHIGRKRTYFIFFVLGLALYVSAALAAGIGSIALFVAVFCVILSMYGGGFSTIPAYLADLFGTQYVGAIHGRLLTAWSTAGILGPVLVNSLLKYQADRNVPPEDAYNLVFYVVAGLLFIGFVCNLLVRPVDKRHFMSEDELEEEWQMAPQKAVMQTEVVESTKPSVSSWVKAGIGWALVMAPLGWAVTQTVRTAMGLFR